MDSLDEGTEVEIINGWRDSHGEIGEVEAVRVDVRYDVKLKDETLLDCHAEEVQEIGN